MEANTDNYVLVSGADPTWVNGIVSRLNETLQQCPSQPELSKWRGWISFAVWLAAIVMYFRLCVVPYSSFSNNFAGITLVLIIPLASLFLAIKLDSYLKSLWPSIEIQTGPQYLQLPKTKRNTVLWIAVSILLPLVLSILYDILKSITHF